MCLKLPARVLYIVLLPLRGVARAARSFGATR
jgi:hypothetical protein